MVNIQKNNHLSIINNHLAYANRLSSPNCRGVAFCEAGTSTTVEKPLQISYFMQNKANFPDAQMNVTSLITVEYENITNCKLGENKPNTNPTCRGVASGEAGSKPISKAKTSGFYGYFLPTAM